jgi:hypothetical protein
MIILRLLKMPRGEAPEILRVTSRRVKSDSCHAREKASGPDRWRWAFFSCLNNSPVHNNGLAGDVV